MMYHQGCAQSPNDSDRQTMLRSAAEELRSATNTAASNALKKKLMQRLEVNTTRMWENFESFVENEINENQCTTLYLIIPHTSKLWRGIMFLTGPSVSPSVITMLWTLYTVHPLTDLNQTWYTDSIWQGLEAYLFSRS